MTYRQSYPLPTASATRGLGLNLHFDNGGKPGEMQLIKDVGATWVRTDLLWSVCETQPGVHKFKGWDSHFAMLSSLRMRSVNILCYNNPLYMSQEQMALQEHPQDYSMGLYGEAQIQAFLNYVAATVNRYKGLGHIWEFWNEPNVRQFWKPGQDPVQFMNVLERVVGVIRSIAPDEYVAVDVPSTYGGSGAYLERLMQLGLLKHIDVLFIHPYTYTWENDFTLNPESTAAQYTKAKKLVAKYIEKGKYIRIFQGECGSTEVSCTYYNPSPVLITQKDSGTSVETSSENLLGQDSINFSSPNWRGYWMQPPLTHGVIDPLGKNNAVQMASADKLTNPGMNHSGLVHASTKITGSVNAPEWYVLSYYARSTKGCQDVVAGLSNEYTVQHVIDDSWRRYWITFKVTQNVNRTFQIYESQPNNEPWQIAYPQVERVSTIQDTPERRKALQADFLVRLCKTALQNGVGMFIVYNWGDPGSDTNAFHLNFGILEEDRLTPKPAYFALQKAYQYWKINGTPR